MGISSHPDWEWVPVGADQDSYTENPGLGPDVDQFPPPMPDIPEPLPVPPPDIPEPLPVPPPDVPGQLSPELTEPLVDHFDATTASPDLVGDPAAAMTHWHHQDQLDTCAVASQEFLLDQASGYDYQEEVLTNEAATHGWYTPGGGTPMGTVGNLLEAHGVDVNSTYGNTLDSLRSELAAGHGVIVSVNAEELWGTEGGSAVSSFPLVPGQNPDHAVQVTGMQTTAEGRMVILNDPGIPDGAGIMIPADRFEAAWADSDHHMVSTTGTITEVRSTPLYEATLAGYYNADGTYHYTSDNTDRDPETGAIVRYY